MHEPISSLLFKTPEKLESVQISFDLQLYFEYFQCERYWFGFASNLQTEYEKIYSKEYYEGKDTDPLIDYWLEPNQPDKVKTGLIMIAVMVAQSDILIVTHQLIVVVSRFEKLALPKPAFIKGSGAPKSQIETLP